VRAADDKTADDLQGVRSGEHEALPDVWAHIRPGRTSFQPARWRGARGAENGEGNKVILGTGGSPGGYHGAAGKPALPATKGVVRLVRPE